MKCSAKKLIAASLFLTLAVFSACKIVDADSKEDEGPQVILTDVINSAESTGKTITLNSKTMFSTGTEFVIDKKMGLSGKTAGYDMKKSKIIIKASGVRLTNLSGVEEILVTENVGDGDCFIDNCEVEKITVEGGGSNSIHIKSSKAGRVISDYENVRLVLEDICNIGALHVEKTCKIETKEVRQYKAKCDIGHVKVKIKDENVDVKVHIKGRYSIDNFITKSKGSKKPKIVTESKDISISKAGNLDESGNVTDLDITSGNDEVDIPFYDSYTKEEAAAADNNADTNVKLEDIKTDVNNPGCLFLVAEEYGVHLKIDVPDGVNQINIYRAEEGAEEGNEQFYLAGIYHTSSKRALPGIVNWVDYYVEPDTSYTYYVTFISSGNNNIVKVSEQDTISTKGGLGILQFEEGKKPELNFDDTNFQFTISGDPVINIHGEPTSKLISFYFKPEDVTDEMLKKPVESTNFSYMGITYKYNKVPAESVKVQFAREEDIGKTLLLHKLKCNVAIQKNDIQCEWVSIPEDGSFYINGVLKNKVKFTEANLPIVVRKAEAPGKGVDFTADLSKVNMTYGDGKIWRIQCKARRNMDSSYIYVKPGTGSVFGAEKITVNYSDVKSGSNSPDLYDIQLCPKLTIPEGGTTIYPCVSVGVYITPATGNGENSLRSGMKLVNWNSEKFTAELDCKGDEILNRAPPASISVKVDSGDWQSAEKSDELIFAQGVSDISNLNSSRVSFSRADDGTFTADFYNALKKRPALFNTNIWPFASRAIVNYHLKDIDENLVYKLEHCVAESSLNYVKGLPEPFKVTEPAAEPDPNPEP